MRRARGFTLLELVIVVIVIVVLIALLIPTMGPHPPGYHNMIRSASQLKGIVTGIVSYADSNGGYYPGLNKSGDIVDPSTEFRFDELLTGNYFAGELVISPFEVATVWTTGKVTHDDYSYALLQIDNIEKDAGRIAEWRNTINGGAVLISDRNTGTVAQPRSVVTEEYGETGWQGNAGFGDNHTEILRGPILPTKYGDTKNMTDNLFIAAGPNDAMMTFSKDEIALPRRRGSSFNTQAMYYTLGLLGTFIVGMGAGVLYGKWKDSTRETQAAG